jgi:hypothetical protein
MKNNSVLYNEVYTYSFQTGYYLSSTFINFLVNVSTCGMYITVLVKALQQAKKMANIVPTPTAVSISNRSSQSIVAIPQIVITSPPPDDQCPPFERPQRKSTLIEGYILLFREKCR